jgi:5-methyltetrahydrofolate--homocysteine methyltransferase
MVDRVPLLRLPPRTLLDGAMGTALIARGLDPRREPCEAWNLSQPDAVSDVHRRFVAAGCDLIQTNTFGGNRVRLRTFGRDGDVAALNRAAVDLAAAAAGHGMTVVGTIGPSGMAASPEADLDLVELEDAFAEQAAILAAAGAGFLHLETFYHPKELRAALRGARLGAPDHAVIGSFTCGPAWGSGRSNDPLRTPAGYAIESMLNVLLEEGADGIGVNCSMAPAAMAPVVALLVARAKVPLIPTPLVAQDGSAPLLAGAVDLFVAGAAAVGGCCGTGPADLAALRAALG